MIRSKRQWGGWGGPGGGWQQQNWNNQNSRNRIAAQQQQYNVSIRSLTSITIFFPVSNPRNQLDWSPDQQLQLSELGNVCQSEHSSIEPTEPRIHERTTRGTFEQLHGKKIIHYLWYLLRKSGFTHNLISFR